MAVLHSRGSLYVTSYSEGVSQKHYGWHTFLDHADFLKMYQPCTIEYLRHYNEAMSTLYDNYEGGFTVTTQAHGLRKVPCECDTSSPLIRIRPS